MKVTVNLAIEVVDQLKQLAVTERASVGTILEALATAAFQDDDLRLRAIGQARATAAERRSRKSVS